MWAHSAPGYPGGALGGYSWHGWLKTKNKVKAALLEDLSQSLVPRGLKVAGHTYSGTALIDSRILVAATGRWGGGDTQVRGSYP